MTTAIATTERQRGGHGRARPGTPTTPRQDHVLAFIRQFHAANGYPPTLREIGRGLGIGSPNGVMCHLRALEKRGLIRFPGDARSRGAAPVVPPGCCACCGQPLPEEGGGA